MNIFNSDNQQIKRLAEIQTQKLNNLLEELKKNQAAYKAKNKKFNYEMAEECYNYMVIYELFDEIRKLEESN